VAEARSSETAPGAYTTRQPSSAAWSACTKSSFIVPGRGEAYASRRNARISPATPVTEPTAVCHSLIFDS
jgi:hypothetical protein